MHLSGHFALRHAQIHREFIGARYHIGIRGGTRAFGEAPIRRAFLIPPSLCGRPPAPDLGYGRFRWCPPPLSASKIVHRKISPATTDCRNVADIHRGRVRCAVHSEGAKLR
jgi:hypothetical protein